MPIEIKKADAVVEFPVQPETNEHEVLEFLTINNDYAYTPKEIAGETPVKENSINKTLSRLEKKDLVEKMEGGYYHVNQERYEWVAEHVELLHAYQLPGSHGYDESERELIEEETGEFSEETHEIADEIVEDVE